MNKNLNLEKIFASAVQNHQKNNLAEAIDLYKQILKSDPHSSIVNYNLALAFDKNNEIHKAIDHYKEATRIDPNYLSAHFNLGIAFRELGDLEKEISC